MCIKEVLSGAEWQRHSANRRKKEKLLPITGHSLGLISRGKGSLWKRQEPRALFSLLLFCSIALKKNDSTLQKSAKNLSNHGTYE
jgi:hypothetical protein